MSRNETVPPPPPLPPKRDPYFTAARAAKMAASASADAVPSSAAPPPRRAIPIVLCDEDTKSMQRRRVMASNFTTSPSNFVKQYENTPAPSQDGMTTTSNTMQRLQDYITGNPSQRRQNQFPNGIPGLTTREAGDAMRSMGRAIASTPAPPPAPAPVIKQTTPSSGRVQRKIDL